MSDATIFYICGGILAGSALVISFIGLRSEKFPGKFGPAVILYFAVVIGAATTFAVLNGQNEEKARAAENASAGAEFEKEEAEPPIPAGKAGGNEAPAETNPLGGAPAEGGSKPAAKPKGPGGTLKLSASPTALAFDTKELSSKPGEVTIDFDNPAALEHNVAIEQNGKQIAISETLAEGKTSVSADLAPGTYTFLCTVPGHAEAGMEGTLTVK